MKCEQTSGTSLVVIALS